MGAREAMFYVYILASRRVGTLYIGVTNDLHRRVEEHRSGRGSAFTARYGVGRLVYFETYERIVEAIAREKQLKGWNRAWKVRLIEGSNPDWRDVEADVPHL